MRYIRYINYFLWITPWVLLGIVVFILAIIFLFKGRKGEWDKEEDKLIKIDELNNLLPLIKKIEEYFENNLTDLKNLLSEIKDLSRDIIPIVFDELLISYLHEIENKISFLERYLDDKEFLKENLPELETLFKKITKWYKGSPDET